MSMLYTIPIPVSEKEYNLYVVLTDVNIERIRERDPAEIPTHEIVAAQSWIGDKRLLDIIITYATEDEITIVNAMLHKGFVTDALRLLTRGYRYRPELGDGEEARVLS